MFTGTINLHIQSLGKLSKSIISVDRLKRLSFETPVIFKICGSISTQTFNFSLSPYYEAGLIKSISIESYYDDLGFGSLNGKQFAKCDKSSEYKTCHGIAQYSTIKIDDLKTNNTLTLYSKDMNKSTPTCKTSDIDGTQAIAKITIEYTN